VSELTGAAGLPGSDAGPVVDRRTLAAYRERLRRIDAELDSADGGAAEAEALKKEREALLAELSAATGLGGRPRVARSPAERMPRSEWNTAPSGRSTFRAAISIAREMSGVLCQEPGGGYRGGPERPGAGR
jgi:hypothetical protein